MSKITLETIAEQQERILQMLADMRTERERTRAEYQRQYMRDMRAAKALGITTQEYRERR